MATTPITAQTPWTPERIQEQSRRFYEIYTREAAAIRAHHAAQAAPEAAALRLKYQQPVFGEIPTWSLFTMMAQVIDTADDRLYCTSQEIHMLQVVEAMAADGMASEEFILAALVHDLGKVCMLKGEPAENVTYRNNLLATGEPGAGLDQCTLQWSCDDLAWSRLKNHLPPAIAWLVRYHGIRPKACAPYMNAQDHDYAGRYLAPFQVYDLSSKSPFARPRIRLEDYRPIIEKYLPPRIVF
jgi:Myo-inositol oxygenase